MDRIEADYQIVGSGSAGMAFCDVLLSHSDATIAIVDRHDAPGGHWNDAYPFVRLHQPSAYYGVCSKPLGQDGLDQDPLNVGMLERASGSELLTYYADLMQSYVASGRVTYFPACDYIGKGQVNRLDGGPSFSVAPRRKIIDTTYLQTAVPATHAPLYKIADGVVCITPNQLANSNARADTYCVIGAGKTGVDACLYLLEQGVDPSAIRWITPRDAWFQNRANMQRGDGYFEATFGALADQMEVVQEAPNVEAMLLALEDKGLLLRLNPDVTPAMYHGAIMSKGEQAQLTRIGAVVRLGRVTSITPDQITLEQGAIPAAPNTIYVDCSASGVTRRPSVPVFDGDTVTLQMVKPIQPVFSAALIARVETLGLSDGDANQLCKPAIVPDMPSDWLGVLVDGLTNQAAWTRVPELKGWIASTRLDTFGAMARSVSRTDTDKLALLNRFSTKVGPAVLNATRLLRHNHTHKG